MPTKTPRKETDKPTVQLSWPQVAAWRVARQHLDKRVERAARLEVVSRLCGLHAQLMSSAELTLWARVEGLKPPDVQEALWQERSLVKTWAMRGTLHLLPAAEFPLWQAALSNYQHYLKPRWLRAFGVTREELEQLIATIAQSLDGQTLTREQLAQEVGRLTGAAALGEKLRESWGALLKPASFRGDLCFAPSVGQNVRFTRPGSWLQVEPAGLEGGEALSAVLSRFLTAYGPISPADFRRWWGGLSQAAVTKLLKSLGDEVTAVEVEGSTAWLLTKHVNEVQEASPSQTVRLLPAFDQYIIGATSHVTRLLPGPFKARIYRQQGWISPVLLVEGRLDGIWKHERKGNRLIVQIEPFVELPEWARKAALEEAERLADFLGGTLEVSWQA